MRKRSYTELIRLPTFEERFEYLRLDGMVGAETFGSHRHLNQIFYTSKEWRDFREEVIIRDLGCDLGIPGREIHGGKRRRARALIHHLNPITEEQVLDRDPALLDLENVVLVSFMTHQAIHYGTQELLTHDPVVRRPGDTKLW